MRKLTRVDWGRPGKYVVLGEAVERIEVCLLVLRKYLDCVLPVDEY
ncbi:hypothetical protein [Pseudonocardia oroxyli]|nr:hypothetical protein [Pseudonocardia oroxyli]